MTMNHGPHVSPETKDLAACQQFPEEHIHCLTPGSKEQVYAPGETIVRAGQQADGVHIILEGNARVVYSVATPPAPRWSVVDLLGSGKLFGLVPMLDGEPYVAQLEAITTTRTLFVPRDVLLDELRLHPESGLNLMIQLANFVRKTERWLVNIL